MCVAQSSLRLLNCIRNGILNRFLYKRLFASKLVCSKPQKQQSERSAEKLCKRQMEMDNKGFPNCTVVLYVAIELLVTPTSVATIASVVLHGIIFQFTFWFCVRARNDRCSCTWRNHFRPTSLTHLLTACSPNWLQCNVPLTRNLLFIYLSRTVNASLGFY